MNRLNEGMRQLAAELARAEVPVGIEKAVMAEFDRVKRRKRARYWVAAAGAVAASVAAVWLVERHAVMPEPVVPVMEAMSERPFMPIPYVLPPGPYERVEVVRMKVPVAALIAAGLPMRTADQGAQAEADVLVGQDGRARAVRLVSISIQTY